MEQSVCHNENLFLYFAKRWVAYERIPLIGFVLMKMIMIINCKRSTIFWFVVRILRCIFGKHNVNGCCRKWLVKVSFSHHPKIRKDMFMSWFSLKYLQEQYDLYSSDFIQRLMWCVWRIFSSSVWSFNIKIKKIKCLSSLSQKSSQ